MNLTETVVVTRPVDPRIADLVRFARRLAGKDVALMSDDELIAAARDFWNEQHGED